MKICLFFVFVIVLLTGCTSTTTIKEFDLAGNLIKETVADETMTQTIVSSTQNKTIIFWQSGWFVKGKVVMNDVSSGTAFPQFDFQGGKVDTGMALIHKDQQNLDKIPEMLKATRSNLSVTTSGVAETAK